MQVLDETSQHPYRLDSNSKCQSWLSSTERPQSCAGSKGATPLIITKNYVFKCFQKGLDYFCISGLASPASPPPEVLTVSQSEPVHGISLSSDEKTLAVLLGSESVSAVRYYLISSSKATPVASVPFSPPVSKFCWSRTHPDMYATLTSGERSFISVSTFSSSSHASAPVCTIPALDGPQCSVVDFDWSPGSHSLVYLSVDAQRVYRLSRVDFSLESHQAPRSAATAVSPSLQIALEPVSIDESSPAMPPCAVMWPTLFTWFVGCYNDTDGAILLVDVRDPQRVSSQKRTSFFLDTEVQTKFFASYDRESDLIAYGVTSGSDVEFLKRRKDGGGWIYLSDLSYPLGDSLLLGMAWLDPSFSEGRSCTLVVMRREDEKDVLSAVTCLHREGAQGLSGEQDDERPASEREAVAEEDEVSLPLEALRLTERAGVGSRDCVDEEVGLSEDSDREGSSSADEASGEGYGRSEEDRFEEVESDLDSEEADEDAGEPLGATPGKPGGDQAGDPARGGDTETGGAEAKRDEREQAGSTKAREECADVREGAPDSGKKADGVFAKSELVKESSKDNRGSEAAPIAAQKDAFVLRERKNQPFSFEYRSLDKTREAQNSNAGEGIAARSENAKNKDVNLPQAPAVPHKSTGFDFTGPASSKVEKTTEHQESAGFWPGNNQAAKPLFLSTSFETPSKSALSAKERFPSSKPQPFARDGPSSPRGKGGDSSSETADAAAALASSSVRTEAMSQFLQELSSFESTVDQARELQSICLLSPSFEGVDLLCQSVEGELQAFFGRLNKLRSLFRNLHANSLETRQVLSEAQFLFDSAEARCLLSHNQPLNEDAQNVKRYLQAQSKLVSSEIEKLRDSLKSSLDLYNTLKKHILSVEDDRRSDADIARSLLSGSPGGRKPPLSKHSPLLQKDRRFVWASPSFRPGQTSFPTALTASCHQPYVAWRLPGSLAAQRPSAKSRLDLSSDDVFSAFSDFIAANSDEIVRQVKRVKKLERIAEEILHQKKERPKTIGISSSVNDESPRRRAPSDPCEEAAFDGGPASETGKLSDRFLPLHWKWDFLKNDLLRMNDAADIVAVEEEEEERSESGVRKHAPSLPEGAGASRSTRKADQSDLRESKRAGGEKGEVGAVQKKSPAGAAESTEPPQRQREVVNPFSHVEAELARHLNIGQRVPLKGASFAWKVQKLSPPFPPSKSASSQQPLESSEDASETKKEGVARVAEQQPIAPPTSEKPAPSSFGAPSDPANSPGPSPQRPAPPLAQKDDSRDREAPSKQGQPTKDDGSNAFQQSAPSPTADSSSSAPETPGRGTLNFAPQNKTAADTPLSNLQVGQQDFKEGGQKTNFSPFSAFQAKSNAFSSAFVKQKEPPSVPDVASSACTSPQTEEFKKTDPADLDVPPSATPPQSTAENKTSDKPADAATPSSPKAQTPSASASAKHVQDENKAPGPTTITPSSPKSPQLNAFPSFSATPAKAASSEHAFSCSSLPPEPTPSSPPSPSPDSPRPASTAFGTGASKPSSASSPFPFFSPAAPNSSGNGFQGASAPAKDGTSPAPESQNATGWPNAAPQGAQSTSAFGKTGTFPSFTSSSKFGQTSTFGSTSAWPSSFSCSYSQGGSNNPSGFASGSGFQSSGNDGFKKYLDSAKNNAPANPKGGSVVGGSNAASGFGNVSRNAPSGFANAAINAGNTSGFGASTSGATAPPSSSFGVPTDMKGKSGFGGFSNSNSIASSGFSGAAKSSSTFGATFNNGSGFGNVPPPSSAFPSAFSHPYNNNANNSAQFDSNSASSNNNQFGSATPPTTGFGNSPLAPNASNFENRSSLFGKTSAFAAPPSAANPKSGAFAGFGQVSNPPSFGTPSELKPKSGSGFQSAFGSGNQAKPSNSSIWNSARR